MTVTLDGTYVFAITVVADTGDSATDSVVVLYDTVAPVVDAGLNAVLKTGAYTQNATVTDINSVNYVWSVDAGPGSVSAANVEDPSLSVSADGSYTIRLTASDAAGNSAFDTFTLDWDSTNPNVDAGVDQLVGVVTPQAATTFDTNALTWSWSQISGPGTLNFSSPAAEDTNISASLDGIYVARLQATDSYGNTNSDTMTFEWDTTVPYVTDVTANSDGYYGVGQSIDVEVVFSETVTVTGGTPFITLEMGGTDKDATYVTGSGSSTLTFSYIITPGDNNADLDYVNTASLNANGATVEDNINLIANLTLPVPGTLNSISDDQAIVVDTIQPSLMEVSTFEVDGVYGAGASLDLLVVFNENVVVFGTPQLTLETGASDAVVNYSSGSGTDTLTFSYTVSSGEASLDLDYLNTTALTLPGGAWIRDPSNNTAFISLPVPNAVGSISDDKDIVIDTVTPYVSEVRSSSVDGLYGESSLVPIEIVFSEVVNVSGTPQITLEAGAADAVVSYSSGSGTDTLTFNYTVSAGEMNSDLDYVGTTSLSLNGGTIGDGANTALLSLSLPGLPGSISDNQQINIDTSGPSVTQVTASKLDGTYSVSETIDILVEWSESVIVTGFPILTLETGATDATVSYFAGSGSNILTFRYTVTANEQSADLDYQSTSALTLSGGTIKNVSTADANLTLPTPGIVGSISDNQAIVIDAVVPLVSQVSTLKANGSYSNGESIDILVEFDEAVNVLGTPQITLETGLTDAVVNYSSGTGTNILTFSYLVTATDSSLDLDYQTTGSLALGGGSIKDIAGNNADLLLVAPGALGSISDDKAIIIDNTSPSVTSVQATNADGGYGVGAPLSIEVIFDEVVSVVGVPKITLEMGVTDRDAFYSSGDGTDTLTFTYNVVAGDTTNDLDYTSTFALALNGGAIDDIAGNSASLGLVAPGAVNSISDDQAIVIDTTAPVLGQVLTLKANGTYGNSEVIDIIIEYSEAVTVTGTPKLILETGVLDQQVSYSSGSGTNLLTFSYTVASGNASSDLDYVSTSALNLNGGTIKDAGSNDAPILLAIPGAVNSISDDKAIVIDGTAPMVTEVRSTKLDGGYSLAEVIDILVVFDEVVYVSGSPELELETGAVDKPAVYLSGSASDTLTFRYIVAAGDITTDLDYKGTTSLILNGGSIGDSVPNAADLTLAVPGTLNSISDNQAILVDSIDPVIDAGTDKWVNALVSQDATVTDDTVLVYSWTQTTGPGTVGFSSASIEDPNLDADTDGTYTLQLEVTDEGGNTVTDSIQFVWDTTPPPILTNFSGATTAGLNNGIIDMIVDFPAVITDYEVVEIRGIEGATAPTDCTSGTVLKSYSPGSFTDDNYEQETNYPGGFFSARACIWDKAGNETSSQTMVNVQASKQHKFFVTSADFNGNLKADYMAQSFTNSQEGADFRCQSLADTASITTGSDKWVAILSTPLISASSKIQVNGVIKNLNADIVANSKFDLWDGVMTQTNDWDENVISLGNVKIWTGTLSAGSLAASHCSDFSDGTTGFTGRTAQADKTDAQWISRANESCDKLRNLWCISQNTNFPDMTSVNITTGLSAREVDYSFTLANNNGVERFYQKVEVYRKTSAGAPTFNCDGSDGSILAKTFNGPFVKGQVLTFTDPTPGAPGTVYNYTVCTYDKDSNSALRSKVLGVSSGL